jgi:predicted dehydrogenase
MSQTYSVLMIGCGAIAGGYDASQSANAGQLTHAGAYCGHGGYRLAACVDPDRQRRDAFAQRWSVEVACRDVEEAGINGPFDVVSICSPTELHAEHLEAALELQPRLIFCEKPVTPNLLDTKRLVAACDAAGVLLAVNHTRRWAPDIVRLRNELASGKWGAVRAANGVYNKGALNNGSHMIDLLHFLLGPLKLVAAGAPIWDFWNDDPTVPAVLSTAEGAAVTLGIAHAADYALFELSIVTERGVVGMEDGGVSWRLRSCIDSPLFPGYRGLDRGEWRSGEYDRAMLAAVTEIHAAITHGRSLASTGHSAAAAQELCAAIKAAALARPNARGTL